MELQIRTGHPEELDEIMEMLRRCIQVMQEGGSDQWNENYPNREVLADDLQRGVLFAAEAQGKIAAIVVLDEEQDDLYETIEWKDTQGPHLIMHRLAVDPRMQGQGIARRMVEFAEAYAREQGYRSLRLDTYARNTAALKLYRGLSYEQRGEVRFPGRIDVFPVFEKVLETL